MDLAVVAQVQKVRSKIMKKYFTFSLGLFCSMYLSLHSHEAENKKNHHSSEERSKSHTQHRERSHHSKSCKPMIYVPLQKITLVPQGLAYAKFNVQDAIQIGGGFTICDSELGPRITICEEGIYSIKFVGTAFSDFLSFSSGSSSSELSVSLVELSQLSNPHRIELGTMTNGNNSFLGGEIIRKFCHICEDNPPSFAIMIENSDSANIKASFGAGSAIIIEKIASCDCHLNCEDCCSPCCPITPATILQNESLTEFFNNGGLNGGGLFNQNNQPGGPG